MILRYFLLLAILSSYCYAQDEIKSTPHYDIFAFDKQVILPGTTGQIFDAATGDISSWWDHSFTENPKRLFIEPKPGGGFWEIFDDAGNGALHATVIYCKKPTMIRFDGPLGLSGKAVQFVTTYEFSEAGNDSTLMKVSVHGSGELDEGMSAIAEKVWNHLYLKDLNLL